MASATSESQDLSGDVATERANKHNVVPSARVSKGRPATEQAGSDLPGAQTVFVRTWGCGHNTSDGEYMAGLLNAYGVHECALVLGPVVSCVERTPKQQQPAPSLCRQCQS